MRSDHNNNTTKDVEAYVIDVHGNTIAHNHNHASTIASNTTTSSSNATHAYNIPTVAIAPSSVASSYGNTTGSVIVTRPHDHPPVVGRWLVSFLLPSSSSSSSLSSSLQARWNL